MSDNEQAKPLDQARLESLWEDIRFAFRLQAFASGRADRPPS